MGLKRPRGMPCDEYTIVINEAQRRLIMRALTNAMANDRRSTEAVLRGAPFGVLFTSAGPLERQRPPPRAGEQRPWPIPFTFFQPKSAQAHRKRSAGP